MSCRSKQGQPMKVVHINTQYVETDASSFKSVVQNLTGKDSTIADEPPSSWVMKVKKERSEQLYQSRLPQSRLANMKGPCKPVEHHLVLDCHEQNDSVQDYVSKDGGGSYSFLSKNLSFKEMDRLLKEMPNLDELHKVLSFE